MRFGTSLSDVGQYNENAVIHALRALGPSSQGDLVARTGLSVPAVSAIVRTLKQRGYLTELRTEPVARGRPRAILDLVASASYAVGLHVDPAVMSVVVLDLRGQVVRAGSSESVRPDDAMQSLDEAAILVNRVVAESGIDRDRLLGACAAVPGPIDSITGSITDTVWMPGWAGVSIGEHLARRLGSPHAPIPVIKDTLAAVIGENWVRGRESLESTMIFVYLGTGTGVGVSINGEPVRGSSGNAGEIGRMLVALGESPHAGMDNDPFVLVGQAHAQGVLSDELPSPSDPRPLERQFRTLCRLALEGNKTADRMLRDAGSRVAEMVVMVAEVYDADTVVFGGPYWELLQPFYEEAAIAAFKRPSARGPHPVAVLSTAMGTEVGAIGAASAVLDARFVPRAPSKHVAMLPL